MVPEGDLLIHAGDATLRGTEAEIRAFDAWLASLPHPHKVVIAGNHDFGFERHPHARSWITGATYLQDEGTTIGGLEIWGSPWQPWFHDWAFQRQRGPEMAEIWSRIPSSADVLVTHGPPHGILDRTVRDEPVGCEALRHEVLQRIQPRLHVFGHIHEAHGEVELNGTRFVNACCCTVGYDATQPAIVVDLEP